MNELIKIEKQSVGGNETNAVDARILHEFLGSKQQFADWVRSKVVENPFFQENQDFVLLHNPMKQNGSGGHNRKDYALTIDTAKKVAMAEQTERGNEARNYFLECEKKLKEINPLLVLNDPQAMRGLLLSYSEKVIALQSTIEEQRPQVEFVKTLEGSEGRLSIGAFAKLGGNIGRNRLFALLREKKILMNNNLPYQRFIDAGYFETSESIIKRTSGDQIVLTTYVTGKGQTWISKHIDQWSKVAA